MSPQIAFFRSEELAREKRISRESDEARLRRGEISASDLQKRNGLFSSFHPSDMRISKRRVRIKIA